MKMHIKIPLVRDTYKSTVLQFFENIFVLKNLYRQGWVRYHATKESETESVADHSFSVAVLSYLFAREYYPELDADKVLKLALFHDIGEVHAGDIPLKSITTDFDIEEKQRKEKEGVNEVFLHLKHRDEYIALWEEFEYQKSPEARFVREIDKLEFVLQSYLYEKQHVGKMDTEGGILRAQDFIHTPELVAVLEEIRDKIHQL